MKTFLFLLLSMVGVAAQVPTFKSFNPTQFQTNNFIISITNGALVTNINSISTLNLNGTNIVNLFAPLSGGSGSSPFTNIAGIVQYSPGQAVTNELRVVSGSTDAATNVAVRIDSATYWSDAASKSISVNNFNTNRFTVTSLGEIRSGLGVDSWSTPLNGALFQGVTDRSLGENPFYFLLGTLTNSGSGALQSYLEIAAASGGGAEWRFGVNNGDLTRLVTKPGDIRFLSDGPSGTYWDFRPTIASSGSAVAYLFDTSNVLTNGDKTLSLRNAGTEYLYAGPGGSPALNVTSLAADNATNVAFRVSSQSAWSANGSALASFENGSTNQASFSPFGMLRIGVGADGFFSQTGSFGSLRKATDGYSGNDISAVFDDSGTEYNNYIVQSAAAGATFNSSVDNLDLATFGSYLGGTFLQMDVGSDTKVFFYPGTPSNGSAVAYLFDTSNTLTNGDTFASFRNQGTELLGIAPEPGGQAQIRWGGTTNVLYRGGASGVDLIYTNSATGVNQVGFELRNNAGSAARFHLAGNVAQITGVGTVGLYESGGGTLVYLTNGRLWPQQSGTVLGGSGDGSSDPETPFDELNLDGRYHQYGYHSFTNYSRLTISHEGTNGVAQIISAANGIAGIPRDIGVFSNTTQVAGISMGGGFTQNLLSKYLAANATVSDATLVNLSMEATVIAGKKYSFRCVLFVANSLAADGVKIDFDGGSATVTNFRAHTKITDAALLTSTQTTALGTDITAATVTGDAEIEINGSFEPSASGTFIPRFACNADTTGTLTVYRGSNLIFTEIP